MATCLRGSTRDKSGMGWVASSSDLDWVVTRPAVPTDRPATGHVHVFATDSHGEVHSLTRTDLAAFLVARLTSDDHLGTAATIANR